MSEKLTLLDRLLGAGKKKAEDNKANIEANVREQLKGLVYEDELIDELLPIFMGLQGVQGFDKVVELLTTKERQIEAISGGEWFKQESNTQERNEQGSKAHNQETESEEPNMVETLIRKSQGK